MTPEDLKRLVGKTVSGIEFVEGDITAYIVTGDGSGFAVQLPELYEGE
jgi:hypothetical protein